MDRFGNACSLVGGHIERGLVHAQRIKDALFEQHVECLTGGNFQHSAQHICRVSVVPFGPRFEEQRQLADALGNLQRGETAAGGDLLGVLLAQCGVGREDRLNQPGLVRQQVFHCHGVARRADLTGRAVDYLHVGKFGDVLADRVLDA